MSDDLLFQIANTFVLPAWLLLLFLPRWEWTARIVVGVVVALLSVLYTFLVITTLDPEGFEGFGSLEGVVELFQSPRAVLLGWIHYLAFDLMVGYYIVKDATQRKISQWLVAPCLVLCFILGPAGLLLYLIIRSGLTRKYFWD